MSVQRIEGNMLGMKYNGMVLIEVFSLAGFLRKIAAEMDEPLVANIADMLETWKPVEAK